MSYKRYSEYKDSGIEWIGKIPKEWNCIQVKHLFFIGRGRVISQLELMDDGIYPVYSSQTSNDGCLGYIKTYDFDVPLLTWTTDGANAGTIFLRTGKFNCTNVCGTLRKKYDDVDMRYVLYNLSYTAHYHKRLDTNGYKIMNNEMAAIQLCVPSLHDQQSIASYLDTQCALIDKAIETQNKIIEKLKEYKKSIITEAVTKGLDKNAKMKDSGIEWIGEIPEGWKVVKIKNISRLKGRIGWQGLKSNEYIDEGPYLITGTDFVKGKIDWNNCVHISKERFEEAPEIHIKENDLLITKDGTVGKVAIALNCPDEVSLNSGVLLIRNLINIKYSVLYLYYILVSDVFWSWFTSNLNNNSTIIHLYQEQFSNFSLCLPSFKEQQVIAKYLDKKCGIIDKTIANKEKLIEKLQNFKKSLIYECVTGKRKIA